MERAPPPSWAQPQRRGQSPIPRSFSARHLLPAVLLLNSVLLPQLSPLQQAVQCRAELLPPRRHPIVDSWWHLRVHGAFDDAVSLKLSQLLGKHLLGNAGDAFLQVREAQHLSTEEV